MSINLTDEIEVKTKKGKLCAAKQIFLEGDTQTVEKEIQDINSRHNDLSSKHESLSSTVSDHAKQIESNQSQITANKSAQDEKNISLDANMAKLNTRDDQITELVKGVTATGGASVATAVTYDNTSSQLASATVQGAIDELQSSKIDKTSILQKSGDDENSVMSQKATTTAIETEKNRAEAAEKTNSDNIAKNAQTIEASVTKNEEQDQKLSELENKVSDFSGSEKEVEFSKKETYITVSGEYGHNVSFAATERIPVKKGTIITYTGNTSGNLGLAGYDENDTFKSALIGRNQAVENKEIEIPEGIAYLRASTILQSAGAPLSYRLTVKTIGIINELSKRIDNVEANIDGLVKKIEDPLTDGENGYIRIDGKKYTPYTGYATKEIVLPKNAQIRLVSYVIKYMCPISVKNEDGTYDCVVIPQSEQQYNVSEYSYITDKDCVIVVTYATEKEHTFKAEFNTIESLQVAVSEIKNVTDNIDGTIDNKIEQFGLNSVVEDDFSEGVDVGHFISNTGKYLNNPASSLKEFDVKAGAVITSTGNQHPSVAVFAKKNDDGTYKVLLTTNVGFKVETHTYTVTEDMTIVASFYDATGSRKVTIETNVIKSISTNVDSLIEESKIEEFNKILDDTCFGYMFDKIAVVGDSLASGRVEGYVGEPDAVGADFLNFSWIAHLAKRWRCSKKKNYSNAGATTQSWITQWLPKLQADETVYDCYFIALGTNNEYNESNPSGDAERYEAYKERYNQIVDAVRAKAPNAAIFLVSLYEKRAGNDTLEEMAAVRMAADKGIYYLDFANNAKYLRYSDIVNWRGHFSTTGYVYVASVINHLVNEVVWNNQKERFWMQFAKYHDTGVASNDYHG